MAESEEELKSLLMKVKVESENVGLMMEKGTGEGRETQSLRVTEEPASTLSASHGPDQETESIL